MQCEYCHAELEPDAVVCPECGKPVAQESEPEEAVLQDVEGFDNTKEIQQKLRAIIDEQGASVVSDKTKFVALLNDYLPEYDKERRLLISPLNAGIINNMLKESDRKIAIERARSNIIDELFVAPNAAEFMLACYTYMLGWPYKVKLDEDKPVKVVETENAQEEEKPKRRITQFDIDAHIYGPLNAARHRISRNVNIPDGFSKIDSFCFDGFKWLHTIQLPESVLAIGDYAFSECKALKGVELPSSLKVIEQGAFSQCVKLAVIKIPKGILEIADSTFSLCTSLEVVEIPSTVSSIGAEAFKGCEKLRKLFLPDSVKFIDTDAFAYCPNLTIRCYENSYVHKYCLTNGIKFETVQMGVELRGKKNF